MKPALEATCVRVHGEIYGINDAWEDVVRKNVVRAAEVGAGVHSVGDCGMAVGVEADNLTRGGVERDGCLFGVDLLEVWVVVRTLWKVENAKGVSCIGRENAYRVLARAIDVAEVSWRSCL